MWDAGTAYTSERAARQDIFPIVPLTAELLANLRLPVPLILNEDMAEAKEHKPLSAGVLVWERGEEGLRVLLAHMGGPFWAHKGEGAWTIPKGLMDAGEHPLEAAWREFEEETGIALPRDAALYEDLGEAPGPGNRKILHMFALEARHVPAAARGGCAALASDAPASNTFKLEWPPHSGELREFPEIDRTACMPLQKAMHMINAAQKVFLQRLAQRHGG